MKRLLLSFGIHSGIPQGDELIRLVWQLGISARDLGVPETTCELSGVEVSASDEPKLQSRVREELTHRRQVWLPVLATVFSAIAAGASALSAAASWLAVFHRR